MKRWILIGMVVASGMTIQAQNKCFGYAVGKL